MAHDPGNMTVTIRRTIRKYEGEVEEGKEPIFEETVTETVPLSSLPVDLQTELLATQKE